LQKTVYLYTIICIMLETISIKDTKTNIGLWVKTQRKSRNLSQDQLAEALDLSRLTIQNLEAGKNTTLNTLLKVLQYLDELEKLHAFIEQEIQNNSYPSLY
jgi:transcriptional regulator with XRE-family HTH domain